MGQGRSEEVWLDEHGDSGQRTRVFTPSPPGLGERSCHPQPVVRQGSTKTVWKLVRAPSTWVRAEFILDPKGLGQRRVVGQGETLGQVGGSWGKGHQEVAAAAAGRFWGCLNRSSHKRTNYSPHIKPAGVK